MKTPKAPHLDREQRRRFLREMRVPALTFVGLLALLAINVVIGYLQPIANPWRFEIPVLAAMVALVLLFSMDVIKEPALVRLVAVVGFCWVAVMIALTLTDYAAR